uniref:Uncharacterized protein n=1 Tax=Ixodes ricinus TaxID=34613 RepID=A0A6B0TWS4_IXORI
MQDGLTGWYLRDMVFGIVSLACFCLTVWHAGIVPGTWKAIRMNQHLPVWQMLVHFIHFTSVLLHVPKSCVEVSVFSA